MIALESDDEEKKGNSNDPNSPIMSFQDERQLQAYLAANPTVEEKYKKNHG